MGSEIPSIFYPYANKCSTSAVLFGLMMYVLQQVYVYKRILTIPNSNLFDRNNIKRSRFVCSDESCT